MHRFILPLTFAIFGCSSSSQSQPGGNDAGSSEGGVEAGVATVTVTGRVYDYATNKGLAGATVTEVGATTTTDADGKWSLKVPINTPSSTLVFKDGYIRGHMPEEIYSGDYDRGDMPLPDLNTFMLAELAQNGYDESKAAISIVVRTLPSCASDDGATLTVTAPDGTSTVYFKGGLPSASATAVSKGQSPAINVYNIPAGDNLTLTLTHPTCKQVPFPYTEGNATFTGNTVTEAGKSNSALVLFLQ